MDYITAQTAAVALFHAGEPGVRARARKLGAHPDSWGIDVIASTGGILFTITAADGITLPENRYDEAMWLGADRGALELVTAWGAILAYTIPNTATGAIPSVLVYAPGVRGAEPAYQGLASPVIGTDYVNGLIRQQYPDMVILPFPQATDTLPDSYRRGKAFLRALHANRAAQARGAA